MLWKSLIQEAQAELLLEEPLRNPQNLPHVEGLEPLHVLLDRFVHVHLERLLVRLNVSDEKRANGAQLNAVEHNALGELAQTLSACVLKLLDLQHHRALVHLVVQACDRVRDHHVPDRLLLLGALFLHELRVLLVEPPYLRYDGVLLLNRVGGPRDLLEYLLHHVEVLVRLHQEAHCQLGAVRNLLQLLLVLNVLVGEAERLLAQQLQNGLRVVPALVQHLLHVHHLHLRLHELELEQQVLLRGHLLEHEGDERPHQLRPLPLLQRLQEGHVVQRAEAAPHVLRTGHQVLVLLHLLVQELHIKLLLLALETQRLHLQQRERGDHTLDVVQQRDQDVGLNTLGHIRLLELRDVLIYGDHHLLILIQLLNRLGLNLLLSNLFNVCQ